MVFKKSADCKGSCAQYTDPADFLSSQNWMKNKVEPYCCQNSQQGAEKLSETQSEKDCFLIVLDFFGYFDFYLSSLLPSIDFMG